jgi:hypothetical protein
MVSRRIESGRKSQNVGRAELHAEPAPLAALHSNGDEPFGHIGPPDVTFMIYLHGKGHGGTRVGQALSPNAT